MTVSNDIESAAQYGRDILTGKIKSGKLARLAVQRHYDDLENGHKRGLFFCEHSASRVLKLFDYLKHSKGELSGQPIKLEPWQIWIISCVFGWKYEKTGFRRFKTVYEEVAKKNGKTTKLAGIGLYGLIKDDEGGPEIYCAATKRDQARILFEEASRMIKQSAPLRHRLDVQKHKIECSGNFGKMEPLSADADTMDGLNPHFPLIDELHAHKSSSVWDNLTSALGSRKQALLWAITTAGFNKHGICYDIRGYAEKVLNGALVDDSFFSVIFTLDQDDDWQDENNWIKANPNLNVSVSIDYLREQAKQASVVPTAKTNFLVKHLNTWVSGENAWCNTEKWSECFSDYDQNQIEPVEVYFGLDLASMSDIASIGGIAVMSDGSWRIIGRHYLPEESVKCNFRKIDVPFLKWHEEGWLTLTPGNVIDYNWIKSDILNMMERFNVIEIAFDRWNSSQLVNDLMDINAPMVSFGQGFVSMNAPMKELERRYLSKEIQHNNDPVLNWAMSNLIISQDPAGNIKPAKNKSNDKIDPAAALIMAVGRAMLKDNNINIDDFLNDPIII